MTGDQPRLLAWCALDTEASLFVIEGVLPTVTPARLGAPSFPTATVPLDPDGSTQLALVRATTTDRPADGIRIGDGDNELDLTSAQVAACRLAPEELLTDHLCGLDESGRVAVVEFLVESAVVGDRDGIDDTTAHTLHRFREALRPRWPRAVIEREGPRGGAIESFVKIDDHTAYLRGWLGWAPSQLRRVTAVSPEGERVEIGTMLHRHRRNDVDAFYGESDPRGGGSGIATVLTTVGGSRLARGWLLEVETLDGSVVELGAPEAVTSIDHVRDALIAELALDDDRRTLCEQHLSRAINRLSERRRTAIRIDEVMQFGRPSSTPAASVIVPLFRRLDLMEYQLGQFSLDPAMADVDLIYVLDSPEQADELRAAAARWHRLYRQPFRLAILSANGGFSLANNLGADLASGPELILCNSDVLPEGPGWVAELLSAKRRAVDHVGSSTGIGAVGPMLVYEDDSLQHAGMYFDRIGPDAEWCNEHYFKGLHRSFAPANRSREVPAVTGACMLVATDRYRAVGGLSLGYVQGDYEDSDLCLRLAEDGGASWYTAEVTLYHLEGGSYPSPERARYGSYNRWLHERRWGATIEQLMSSGRFDPTNALDPTDPALATVVTR